jgi:L-fucose isomerase-like protein
VIPQILKRKGATMVTLGVIVGNRGFFPDHLCDSGRQAVLQTLEKRGLRALILPTTATKFGAVETMDDAQKCADLFNANRDKIDGLLVTLPNFGDERGVANAIRWSGLKVPVLVQAFNDDPKIMTIKDRRDSFCGKMSVCNNLRQYGIPFTLTRLHTVNPDAAWCVGSAICESVRWAPGPRRSTQSATVKSCWNRPGSVLKPWTCTRPSVGSVG